jgi:hypothetical protein
LFVPPQAVRGCLKSLKPMRGYCQKLCFGDGRILVEMID